MSTTIGGIVDRVFREYLEPADDLNSYTAVSTTFNASATSVSFNADLLTQEEEDVMDAGTILECEHELMYCTDVDTVNNTVTVVRGTRGTTAVEHVAGKLIKIAPAFTRKAVFDAVCDQIANLYPSLYAVETVESTSGTGYTLLGTYDSPGTNNYLVAPIKALSQYTDWSAGSDQTGLTFKGVAVEMIDLPNPFTYTDSTSTERTITYTTGPDVVHALQFSGIAAGHTVYVTFKKKFIQPTAETDTLTTIGLQDEWEPIIMAGAAAQMLSGRDIPAATADFITDQLAIGSYPVGASSNIRNGLLSYQQTLLDQAKKDLKARYPEPVALNQITYPS
jgi:hypothetical protein|tara:strand:- start:198 stop:1202 length:1005 start_codon:yes stop_codon:yes gene_type:complete